MLYTMIHDYRYYLAAYFDQNQINRLVGVLSDENRDKHIELTCHPHTYKGVFEEPLRIAFQPKDKTLKNCTMPDLGIMQGRLFLNQNAYDILSPIIGADGEFLPAIYNSDKPAYIFNPLRVAEDVDGLDVSLSKEDEFGEVAHLAFHEEKLGNWSLFRAKFNYYHTLQCRDDIKKIIEDGGLTGLYFTPDLGRIFPGERGPSH